jgi:2-iminobutanoate/2-iminopropanoate deaminase
MAADKTPRAIHHVDVPGYSAAHSPYSHAVVANGFVFVSGQIPVRPGGGPTIGTWLRAHASAL